MNLIELTIFLVLVTAVLAASLWLGPLIGLGPWTLAEVAGGAVVVLVGVALAREWLDPAKRHEARGNKAHQRGQFARAIDEYTAALAAGPEFPGSVHFSRGIACHDAGDYDQAIADYDRALEISPGIAAAQVRRGQAYQARGDYDRALADFEGALALSPHYADAYYRRGLLHEERGELREALADLDRALAQPGGPAAAAYRKAQLHEQLAEPQQALTAYRRFLKRADLDDPNRKPVRERVRELRKSEARGRVGR